MGSVGPLGGFIKPLGEISVETAFDVFIEQARSLIAGGVDAIIIETMTATEELETAVRAAREAGASVILASMAFDKTRDGYRTMMGVSIEQAVEAMTRAGADVIGCNCGARLAMNDYVEIVRRMRSCSDEPIIVEPNAGQAELIGDAIMYDQTAYAMAEKVEHLIQAGAGVIGGCCGTTPEYILAFNAARLG
jgi:5-methyltetrahydrofolate--homocysteine methyltransferase